MAGDMITINQKAKCKRQGGSATFGRFLLCVLCFAPLTCAAEALQDPTRPPAALSMPQGSAAALAPSGPQLQSVQISAGRRSAIISGQRVRLGDKVGDARVVRINENEVVLKGGSGLQTLQLFPNVDKRVIIRTQRYKR